MRALRIACVLVAGLLFVDDGLARGSVTICNKGEVDLRIALLDQESAFGEKPTLIGWYALNVGKCFTDRWGVNMDAMFGFKGTGKLGSIVFDASRLHEMDILGSGIPTAALKQSNRSFCVTLDRFQRKGSLDELARCPPGWVLMPFSWALHDFDMDESKDIELTVRPRKTDTFVALGGEAGPATPPPDVSLVSKDLQLARVENFPSPETFREANRATYKQHIDSLVGDNRHQLLTCRYGPKSEIYFWYQEVPPQVLAIGKLRENFFTGLWWFTMINVASDCPPTLDAANTLAEAAAKTIFGAEAR